MTPTLDSELPEGFENAPCPLCGSASAHPVVHAGDRLRPGADESYSVVSCQGCGVSYLRPRPTPQAIGGFYPDSYTGGGRRGPLERVEAAFRRRQHGEVVRWLAARRPKRGRVLDVGCGAGDLLVALRADGWETHGVEPSAPGATEAHDGHGLDVVHGRFEDARLPAAPFDAVVFSGVIEHLHDPLGALRRARTLLAPGGLIAVLFVPLLDSPQARFFGPRWLALDLPRHLTHFERRTFVDMASAAGLMVASSEAYSRRHSASQLVGSLFPALQKHRFYLGEAPTWPRPQSPARSPAWKRQPGMPRSRRSSWSRRRRRLAARDAPTTGRRFYPSVPSSMPTSVSWTMGASGSSRTVSEPHCGHTGRGSSVVNSSLQLRHVAATGLCSK